MTDLSSDEDEEDIFSDNEEANYTAHHSRVDILVRPMAHQPRCSVCYQQPYKMSWCSTLYALLPNCCHSVCVDCMRTWRKWNISKGAVPCPECRIPSNYYYPSRFWPCEADKQIVIAYYKKKLANVHCRLYERGWNKCRYYSDCPYKHQLPNGVVVQPKLLKSENPGRLHFHVRQSYQLCVYVYNTAGIITDTMYTFTRPRTRASCSIRNAGIKVYGMYTYT